MTTPPVRVRFAPSPTGTLHVGSARTALFSWLFAKHSGGTFILRIEDTDAKRSNPAFAEDIFASLKYLGLTVDEGPFYQSQRLPLYKEHLQRLLDQGKAVHKEGAVVFPVPPGSVTFHDLVHGDITVDTSLFENLVLQKSDGLPTYNFACVVDDADMRISHVIRGDDHIANTPKQVVLYQALGFPLPQFAHIPLIVGADRARLSKRAGATAVSDYRTVGYLPDGFVNYLALLGWSPGGNREVMSIPELVEAFDITRIRKTAAQFDQQKLDWLNGQHIKRATPQRLAQLFAGRLVAKGWMAPGDDLGRLTRIATVLKERLRTLSDIEEENAFFFVEPIEYQPEAVEQHLRAEGVADFLLALRDRLKAVEPFDTAAVEQATRDLIAQRGQPAKALIHPIRVAVTGRAVSPPLFDTLSILGKDTVLRRLEHAATQLARKGVGSSP
jgi:glutamyl-tRNA synthetase